MSDRDAVPLTTRARRFAALSGPFDPVALLDALAVIGEPDEITVLADLASVCDTSEPMRWLMRGTVRRDQLDTLAAADELKSAVQSRREQPHDEPAGDLLNALSGSLPFTKAGISKALKGALDRDLLTRIAVALDRGGSHAPVHDALESVRAALGRADDKARGDVIARRGFYGRRAEMKTAERWLSHPQKGAPITALLVTGIPGAGKTTLIEEIARVATRRRRPWIVVRLDFDRGGLDIQDRIGFTMELSRLVARELGPDAAALRSARLAAAGAGSSTGPNVKGAARDRIPDDLAAVLGDATRASGRPILLILDTVEALRGRGETHPQRLFETLDELCSRGLQPLSVIAAARADSLAGVPDRIGDRIELTGLDDESADRLLAQLEVSPALFSQIKEVSGGIPLALRVGALAVRESGAGALEGVTERGTDAADYLYRYLVSRIADDTLRALSVPGLIPRRIHPDLITKVLAPQVGLKKLTDDEVTASLEALSRQDWLVEPDPTPGWLRFRADVRPTLLENIYATEKPAAMVRLNRALARWFDSRPESFAPLEAAYHRLQAMRGGGEPPPLSAVVLDQFDDATLDELPAEAGDTVRVRRGSRTSRFRGDFPAPRAFSPEAAAAELEMTLERNDIREARYVFDRSFGVESVAPDTAAADVARAYLWRAGRWSEAIRDFDPARIFEGESHDGSQTVTLAQFEMCAEFHFEGLAQAFGQRPELTARAVELRRRGIDGALGNGALGFALVRAGESPTRGSWSVGDPVEAAASLWSAATRWTPGSPDPDVLDALAMQFRRFTAHVSGSAAGDPATAPTAPRLPDLSTPAGAARVLGSATPYISVVENLLSLDPGSGLGDELSQADRAVAAAGGIPPVGAGDWQLRPAFSPAGALENLAAVGLFAEWLGATALKLESPDLTMIAVSAERWRRTTAGSWAYSPLRTVSAGWRQGLDASMRDRISQLKSEADCLDQARTWLGAASEKDTRRLLARLNDEHPIEADADRRALTTDSIAARLLEAGVPSAFAPALAVLQSIEGKE